MLWDWSAAKDDAATRQLLAQLDDGRSRNADLAERAMLRGLGGGCQVPIGSLSRVADGHLTLDGVVLSPDGRRRISNYVQGPLGEAESLGQRLAEQLLRQGAKDLLGSPRG